MPNFDIFNNDEKNELRLLLHERYYEESYLYFLYWFVDADDVTEEFFEKKVLKRPLDKLRELFEADWVYWLRMRRNFRIDVYRRRSKLPPHEEIENQPQLTNRAVGVDAMEVEDLVYEITDVLNKEDKKKSARIIRMLAQGRDRQEICMVLESTPETSQRAISRAKKDFLRVLCTLF